MTHKHSKQTQRRILEICKSQGLELIKKLGDGAHGYVFEARNLKNNELCAVKVFPKNKEKIPFKTFQKEVLITQSLHGNSHIVKLQKAFLTRDFGFMVVEKLHIDLMDYILNQKRLSENDAKKIFKEICLAVKQCHDSNIAHLDLKPENVLLNFSTSRFQTNIDSNIPIASKPSQIKLCDFGHSFNFSQLATGNDTKRTVVPNSFKRVGTKQYRAPELSSISSIISPSTPLPSEVEIATSDIWSLGIVLFVMITGFFPYADKPSISDDRTSSSSDERIEDDYKEEILNLNVIKQFASFKCYDLLTMMLEENPQFRLDIDEVLAHDWFSVPNAPIHDDHHITRKRSNSSDNHNVDHIPMKLLPSIRFGPSIDTPNNHHRISGSFHQLLFSSVLPSVPVHVL